MLEDQLNDIINKACRGTGQNFAELDNIEELARKLNLSYPALQGLERPFEPPVLPYEVDQITTSFGHLGVNCFWVKNGSTSYLIDTGTEKDKVKNLRPDFILITHRHPDHTACLDCFSTPIVGPENLSSIIEQEIVVFDVSGHHTPSAAYYFPELSLPVCFVGDAIFKRSIGGCPNPKCYKLALQNIKSMLEFLPGETILCVGHGPNTTVNQELAENPFFSI